jgi:hypothetical protein
MISLAHAETAAVSPDPTGGFMQLLPMLILSALAAWATFNLAKNKGLNSWKWAIFALIPGINLFVLIYVAGLRDELLHKKIDLLLNQSSTLTKEQIK